MNNSSPASIFLAAYTRTLSLLIFILQLFFLLVKIFPVIGHFKFRAVFMVAAKHRDVSESTALLRNTKCLFFAKCII